MVLLGTGFGAYGVGAVAQDQVEAESVQADIANIETQSAADNTPAIRFVASEVVQDIPEDSAPVDLTTDANSLRELVATTAVSEEMSREVRCLAQAVYFEARGEPLAGQLAVAKVVINRADHAQFPDDYCSVVTQRAQFSFVRGGRIPQPNAGSAAWNRARAIARIAHRDMWESEADDALYFHATYVKPRWARHKTTRARIDSHIFYR